MRLGKNSPSRLAAGFASSLQRSRPIYLHRYIISAPMGTITTQTTDVCPCRTFMVRRPTYFHSPALVSSMAAIGAMAAGIAHGGGGFAHGGGHLGGGGGIPVAAAMAVK